MCISAHLDKHSSVHKTINMKLKKEESKSKVVKIGGCMDG